MNLEILLKRYFLLKYDDAASRLKATEALKDVVPVLKIQGNKVTFEYTANMSKFLDAYGDVIGKKQFSYKENAINYIVGLAKTTYGNLKYHTVDWDEKTSTVKSVLKDGVIDTKTKRLPSRKFQIFLQLFHCISPTKKNQ